MLAALFSWLNPLKPVLSALENAYAIKLKAANDAERIEADKQIAFFQGQIALAQTAAQSVRWWSPRSLMGFSAALDVAKIIVFDTVLQLGVTPNPGGQVTGIVMTVIGFYFGSKTVSDIGGRVLAAWAARK